MVKEAFGESNKDIGIGAEILVRAAISEEFTGHSGEYYDNDAGRFNDPHAAANDSEHAASIVRTIEEILQSY